MFKSLLFKLHKEDYLIKRPPSKKRYGLITLLRVRNESLILEDTLEHLSTFSDGIVAYDDCSDDTTLSILKQHPKVLAVIANPKWEPTILGRLKSETSHRKKLMDLALTYQPEWLFCSDADERFVGDIRGFIDSPESHGVDSVRVSLFDAYMTPEDHAPYRRGEKLLDFRRFFGVERRDILMMWRPSAGGHYKGLDCREPKLKRGRTITKFYAQHYGKSLSLRHWEDTCDYYVNHFPYETYGKKWEARKGKGVHERSDFDTPLYPWGEALFDRAVRIHPE